MWPTKSFQEYLLEAVHNQRRDYLRIRKELIDAILKKEKETGTHFWERLMEEKEGIKGPYTKEAIWYFARAVLHGAKTWDLLSFYGPGYYLSEKDERTVVREEPEYIEHVHFPMPDMQEYVVQKRPDLISKIKNLNPALKAKYRHEEELGHADL